MRYPGSTEHYAPGKKTAAQRPGKNQGGRGNNRSTKHCEPAKRGKLWCACGAQCHEKSVRTSAGEKIRCEALRKIMAVQRPLKTGRDAEKTVVCPVCKAPPIKRPPSNWRKYKVRSGANCGRCWARSGANFVCGQAVV